MKTSSAKSKGRTLQKWVRDTLLEFSHDLTTDDVRSTSMGAQGEDVTLSPAAREQFPIQIECKNNARFAVYKDYEQAKTHGEYTPVLIIKQNHAQPLAVVDAKWLIQLIKEVNEN